LPDGKPTCPLRTAHQRRAATYKCACADLNHLSLPFAVESYASLRTLSGWTIGFSAQRIFSHGRIRADYGIEVPTMPERASKLTALRERAARIQARIEQLETQDKKQARKDDTRLKILFGAAMMADAAQHPETEKFIRAVLARGITADRDRQFLKEHKWL
jgi:hypothetical protein